jgi:hypothetical protein
MCKDRSQDHLWTNEIGNIQNSNDLLKENYTSISFDKFKSFTMLVSDNNVVAFSGLQFSPDRWSNNTARVLSRFYISPQYRHGANLLTADLYTKYMLPIQLDAARQLGVSSVFMSREHGLQSFNKYISYINETLPDTNFIMLNGKYDVCGIENPVPDSCKQFVALKLLTENGKRDWNNKMLFRRFS